MYEDTQKRNLRTLNIVIIILVLLVVALGINFFLHKKSQPQTYSAKLIAQNMRYPYQASDNALYYFSGSHLVSYDLTSHKTNLLSNTLLPHKIDSLQWLPGGAVISVSSGAYDDDIGQQFIAQNLSAGSPYIWYVPFSGKPVLIASNPQTYYADAAHNKVYYDINDYEGGYGLYSFDVNSSSSSKVGNFSSNLHMRVIYSDNNNLFDVEGSGQNISLVQRPLNDLSAGSALLTNVFNNTYATTAGQISMIDSGHAVIVQQNNDQSDLVDFSTADKKLTTLYGNFTGILTPGLQTIVATNLGQQTIGFLRIKQGIVQPIVYINQPKNNALATFATGDNLLFVNNLAQLSYITKNPATLSSLPGISSDDLSKKLPGATNYLVTPDDTTGQNNSYTVLITINPYHQTITDFMSIVRQAGYDPNQYDFEFIGSRTVNQQT